MASVRSSSTLTKPAGSPLGETSAVPSSLAEAMKTKGAAAMKRRLMSSMTPDHLVERALVRLAGHGADLGLAGDDFAETRSRLGMPVRRMVSRGP